MAPTIKGVIFLLLISIAVVSARDLGSYAKHKTSDEKPMVLVLDDNSLKKDFLPNQYLTSSSEEDRTPAYSYLQNLFQSQKNKPLQKHRDYNRHDHHNHRQTNRYKLQDRDDSNRHENIEHRQRYYNRFRDEDREHHRHQYKLREYKPRYLDSKDKHRHHDQYNREYKQRYHDLSSHEQDRYHDRKRQYVHTYDRKEKQRYSEDGEQRPRYREEKEESQKYRYRNDRDRQQERYDDEEYDREKYHVHSPIVKSLLRISNDLRCDARTECQEECNENIVDQKKNNKCQNKCIKKFECNDDKQADNICQGSGDECAASPEDCAEEQGISTKGELYEPEKSGCKRCKK